MRDLVQIVARYGLRLHGAHLPPNVRGYYSPAERRIYFDLRLTYNERRGTIGHELGHAHHGHDCSTDRNERQADAFAARLLIRPEDYAEAARMNPDREFIADELRVPVDIVEAFEAHCLTRLGDKVYASPKLGRAEWSAHAYGA